MPFLAIGCARSRTVLGASEGGEGFAIEHPAGASSSGILIINVLSQLVDAARINFDQRVQLCQMSRRGPFTTLRTPRCGWLDPDAAW